MASEYFPKQAGTSKRTFQLGAATLTPFMLDASGFTSPHTWVLPDSEGTSGYVLSTDGAGVLSCAGVGASSDQTTPYYIPVGETFTNNINKQNLWHADINVDGTLVINGMLLEV